MTDPKSDPIMDPVFVTTARFRFVSMAEGVSYALLVFFAMPLKYGFDLPQAVRVIGMAHGLLFIAFVITLLLTTRARGWSLGRPAVLFAASLVPLGAIWIERSMRAETADDAETQT